jgi:hypothetical protein
MGRNRGHQRGVSVAAYGELSMATVMHDRKRGRLPDRDAEPALGKRRHQIPQEVVLI